MKYLLLKQTLLKKGNNESVHNTDGQEKTSPITPPKKYRTTFNLEKIYIHI